MFIVLVISLDSEKVIAVHYYFPLLLALMLYIKFFSKIFAKFSQSEDSCSSNSEEIFWGLWKFYALWFFLSGTPIRYLTWIYLLYILYFLSCYPSLSLILHFAVCVKLSSLIYINNYNFKQHVLWSTLTKIIKKIDITILADSDKIAS